MSGEASRTKQTWAKVSVHDTKIFFRKAFRNVRSLLLRGYEKLPTSPIFSGSSKVGPKMQETDSSSKSSSQRWVGGKKDGLLALKGQTNGEHGIMNVRRPEDQKAKTSLQGKSSFLATEDFAKKMEELEMMDESDGNHVLDIDEVVHCYSLLTSPTYLEIVDKFSKDVYQELNLPQPPRNVNNSPGELDSAASIHGLMRKLGSASVHSSMRRLGCSTSVHTSMGKVGSDNAGSMRKLSSSEVHNSKRKLGSESIHDSMRRLSSDSIHGSMRKLGSDSLHSSTRRLGSKSVHWSVRKLDSDSIHGSTRKLCLTNVHNSMGRLSSDSIHDSMRRLSSDSIHDSVRRLSSDSIHGSMRKLGSNSIHSSMKRLGLKSVHGSMRKLDSDSIHGSMRKLRSDCIHGSMRLQTAFPDL
ncbi:hypothetical protein SASPL_149821 [Salvia splendens]|uniref:Uncharacterized protein n=1 Tax=Salvia splendens TaxID=180675 RepID=A0A8X8W6B9_SALSN|nr:hypothetical protein SASPL_149821 [Salvia splendens]